MTDTCANCGHERVAHMTGADLPSEDRVCWGEYGFPCAEHCTTFVPSQGCTAEYERGGRCTLRAGHSGSHRALLEVFWR